MGPFTSTLQHSARPALGPLPVWAVTSLIAHPVQDLLHRRLTTEPGVFLFWGAWGSGKHHYMLHTAREMRETSLNHDVHWVRSTWRLTGEENFLSWLAKQVLDEPEKAKNSLAFIEALPKDRAVTIFLHHSDLLFHFSDRQYEPISHLHNLGACIKLTRRHDVNIIWSTSNPDIAKVALQHTNIQLLGPPDCSRWQEHHVKSFVDQRLKDSPHWTDEDKQLVIKLGTRVGAVACISHWLYTDPKRLAQLEPYIEKLESRWHALDAIAPVSHSSF